MEHIEIKRTIEHAVNQEISWTFVSLVNEMLKELNVNAKFEEQQQNTYFDRQEGSILKLVVEHK